MGLTKLTGTGPGGAYVVGNKWGQQTAEKTRKNFNSLAARRAEIDLIIGGSKSTLYPSAGVDTAFDHPEYWPAKIDWTEMDTGWTVVAECYGVCEDATDELTVRIRNITDGVNYDVASPISSATYVQAMITIPVPAVLGIKEYRLAMISNHATRAGNSFGRIITYA